MKHCACILVCLALSTAPLARADQVQPSQAEIDAWVLADVNADGSLTIDEFPRFIDEIAKSGQTTAQSVRFFQAYDFAFSIADLNDDGRLVPNELRTADTAHRTGGN